MVDSALAEKMLRSRLENTDQVQVAAVSGMQIIAEALRNRERLNETCYKDQLLNSHGVTLNVTSGVS